jgi:ATP-dependent DNA helicase RecG
MIVAIENGFQTALMVPTEILAEQHFETVAKYLKGTPYRCALLVGSMNNAEKQQVLLQASLGELDLIVGTHALIQKNVRFLDLGLVIVDEQHRFGVSQRSHLIGKGQAPDILVMTATPIPRSLALTVYGDLDLSVLDELPPGRKPVKTVVKTEKSREEVYKAIRQEVRKGRQAFIVFPLVDESEKLDIRAATIGVEKLQKEIFPELVIGLIHGRLDSNEKDRLINDFVAGRIQILAATTVIEVGIDIPNATIMMIENAERFGLSQLHQLRGRIGRGQFPGTCILMVDSIRSQDAMKRLDIMRKSSDGFEIAEKDLEIRGPGEFLGTRQSGVPAFRFANIVRDRKWLELARNESEKYLDEVIEQLSSQKGLDRSKILSQLLGQWKRRYQFLGTG